MSVPQKKEMTHINFETSDVLRHIWLSV